MFSFSANDKKELERLRTLSQRPNVQKFLETEIARLNVIESQQVAAAVPGLNLKTQLSNGSKESKSSTKPSAPSKPTRPPAAIPGAKYLVPPSFGWDQKGDWVTVYVRDLPGVGSLERSKVTCDFAVDTFDLCIHDLDGKNYRVLRNNLDKDIIPGDSKLKIKANKVLIKMKKVPGQYGADHWTDLTSKKSKKDKKAKAKSKSDDPMGGIMDLMKDMYDNGDEKMKETIGKAMYDSRMGKKKNINDEDDPTGGMGGMGGMPSFGDDDDAMDM